MGEGSNLKTERMVRLVGGAMIGRQRGILAGRMERVYEECREKIVGGGDDVN
jgi:hypothetical protein